MQPVEEQPTLDQFTTKEAAPFPKWICAYAINGDLDEGKKWRDLRRECSAYRRALKREPEARQLEMVFPLQLTPTK